jgi:hypothetical protein
VKASCCVNFSHKNNKHLQQYCKILEKLHEAITWNRPRWLTARMWLLHDGAWPCTSAQTAAWLQTQKWEALQHPPHSTDIAPSDFYLFRTLKDFISRKRFEDQNAFKNQLCNTSIPWKATLPWRNF